MPCLRSYLQRSKTADQFMPVISKIYTREADVHDLIVIVGEERDSSSLLASTTGTT